MARNGDQDDDFYSEPTQYANYGGSGGQAYSEAPHQPDYGYQAPYPTGAQTYGQPVPEPPTPWYRKPAALVSLGALAALLIALAIYAIVQLTGDPSSTTETTTTTTTTAPATTTAAPVAPPPGQTETVTEAPITTTEAPTQTETATTTTEPTTETTTPSPSVSTSTVTETQTETETVTTTRPFPTLPTLFPRPGS